MKILIIGDLRDHLSSPDFKTRVCLPQNIKEYVNNTSHIQLKNTRIFTYSLLLDSLEYFFGEKDIEIDRTDFGKPYLCSGTVAPQISLSHSGGICSVFISDEGRRIGVDVQKIGSGERMDRISRRFLKGLKRSESLSGVDIYFASLTDNGFIYEKESRSFEIREVKPLLKDNISCEAYLRWTVAEALVKAEGGGMSSLPLISSLSERLLVSSYRIESGEEAYYLSACSYPPPIKLDPLF